MKHWASPLFAILLTVASIFGFSGSALASDSGDGSNDMLVADSSDDWETNEDDGADTSDDWESNEEGGTDTSDDWEDDSNDDMDDGGGDMDDGNDDWEEDSDSDW